ncbi:MAG TPA: aldolase [Candidatus Dormibacteraeota bacterium]|nr:aldolase [Candidatus Dormibacteraeota bacterium]
MRPQTSKLDPLLCEFDLPLRAIYHPLGFSVEIATNSQEVLFAAEESWGFFRKVFSEPAVQLRVAVSESGPRDCPPAPICRGQRHLVANIADAGNYSVCDLKTGFVFSWLTPSAVENRAYLRYHFLESMSFVLLTSLYLTPIHGACVAMEGRGVLLCGDSGAGKSSLAYACARSGWTFLSDDSSRLVRKRKGRIVVGNPYQMRFRESAIDLFPELKDQRLTLRATGELAIELPTARLPAIKTACECAIDFIVFLNRVRGRSAGLRAFSKEVAFNWFEQVICYGERRVQDEQRTSLRNLLTAHVFELRYDDLDSALAQLEALVREASLPVSQPFVVERDSQNG